MSEEKKDVIFQILGFIESLALDCSEHLKNQHEQGENDMPRFYFDNIAKQVLDLKKQRLEEERK